MSDILVRLQEQAEFYSDGFGPLCKEAADEIARLNDMLARSCERENRLQDELRTARAWIKP